VIKQAPRLWQLLLMAAFVLSCFGVLLYLWLSFGGTSPLAAKGYRFHAYFPEATQLAQQADVRISGVPVGKVVKLERGPHNRTDATIELRTRYAPVPRDARAMLRTKTLLGETYVDLSPGNKSSGMLPEGSALPRSAVAETVELDEIFRSFDAPTREAFRTWMQSSSAAIAGRGADLNAALGNLPAFESTGEDILRELNAQSGAVSKTVSSAATVFDALSDREGQLRNLVTQSDRLFEVTAARNQDLANVFRELPGFEHQVRLTLPRLTAFGNAALPTVKQLQPAASALAPVTAAFNDASPDVRAFFTSLGPVVSASKRGVPAFQRTIEQLPPLFEDLQPFLRNVNPIIQYLGLNKREITAAFGNVTAAANRADNDLPSPVHYLRATVPLGPEALSYYPRPLGASRANAYAAPGGADQLATGLPVYDSRPCANGDVAPPTSSDPPTLQDLVLPQVFRPARLSDGKPEPGEEQPRPEDRNVLRPGCTAQGTYPGFSTTFPQLRAEP
jgi:phospholipid/cholesterol/gamma-HCH transport system substrate-binding protein